jgi:hypothetical protein
MLKMFEGVSISGRSAPTVSATRWQYYFGVKKVKKNSKTEE